MTEDPSRVQGRARREVLSPLRFEPYEVVALASGGEVIFTKDQHIQDVAAIIGDSMPDLVSRCGARWTNAFSSELRGWVILHFSHRKKGMALIVMLPF